MVDITATKVGYPLIFVVVYGHHLQNYDELNGGRDEADDDF